MENRTWSTGRLTETSGQIPDPRSAQGWRHPLSVLLTLATAGMLAGARSLDGIAQHPQHFVPDIGWQPFQARITRPYFLVMV